MSPDFLRRRQISSAAGTQPGHQNLDRGTFKQDAQLSQRDRAAGCIIFWPDVEDFTNLNFERAHSHDTTVHGIVSAVLKHFIEFLM